MEVTLIVISHLALVVSGFAVGYAMGVHEHIKDVYGDREDKE